MGELEELKAQAAARRRPTEHPDAPTLNQAWEMAEADLDRALQTAEKLQLTVDESADIVASSLGFKRITDELRKQRDQARADVLALRDALYKVGQWIEGGLWEDEKKALADTESYEQYR